MAYPLAPTQEATVPGEGNRVTDRPVAQGWAEPKCSAADDFLGAAASLVKRHARTTQEE